MAKLASIRIIVPAALIVTAALACQGLLVGEEKAASYAPAAKAGHGHAKGPVAELVDCPLAFAGVHLMKDDPRQARVAYHFCKPVSASLNQCVLYDGTGPDARLIGIEYLVSDEIYQKMPAEEKVYWHEHTFEVDKGLLKSLTMSGEEERKTLAYIRTLWGKVFHTWVEGEEYPKGPARLFWSVTGKEPFVLPPGTKLPPEIPATGDAAK